MKFYGMTDKGLQRDMNQDVFYTHKFSEQVGFAIVCDGMGGQSAGQIASEMVCNIVATKLIESIEQAESPNIHEAILHAISEANIQVYTRSNLEAGYKGMGTTIVLAVVANNVAHIANIGDSRVYLIQNDTIKQITKDHSFVQELLEQGKISQQEMSTHPNKNMITRAVGVSLTVEVDYTSFPLEENMKLLLCSDGLTNMLTDEVIKKIVSLNDAQVACKELIDLANKAGGIDNITVAVIE